MPAPEQRLPYRERLDTAYRASRVTTESELADEAAWRDWCRWNGWD